MNTDAGVFHPSSSSRPAQGIVVVRRLLSAALAASLIVAAAGSAAIAASESPDPAALEKLCTANTPDESALEDCLTAVHHYLVPGSGPSIGSRFQDEDLAATLVDVDWDPAVGGTEPEDGSRLVALLVRYEAINDADVNPGDDWKVADETGSNGDRVTPGKAPELAGGPLPAGQSVEGWVTFQVPEDPDLLDITYSDGMFGDDHEFLVTAGRTAQATDGGSKPANPTSKPKPTAKPTPKPTPKPVTYTKLGSRGWAKLVKDPDRYAGKRFVVYGCISQFDAATGADTFRAEASYRNERYWYVDTDNAIFTGDEDRLFDFVQGDVVSMRVVSLGSFSYETQIGGNTTVPAFEIVSIKRERGSC